jgi:hypothetical protein
MEQRRLAAAVHTYQPLLATFPGAYGMHRARRLCSMPCPEQQVPGARRRAIRAKQADEAVSHVTKQCHPTRGTPPHPCMHAGAQIDTHAPTRPYRLPGSSWSVASLNSGLPPAKILNLCTLMSLPCA